MSAASTPKSPTRYQEDAFATDVNFKMSINQNMRVPDKIILNNNGMSKRWYQPAQHQHPQQYHDSTNYQQKYNNEMLVPERILVAGHNQHIGTRASPLEIDLDNTILPTSGDTYHETVPRIGTPPRSLTLDKYQFPQFGNSNSDTSEANTGSVVMNGAGDNSIILPTDDNHGYFGGNNSTMLMNGEELPHLRKQMAEMNRRLKALERDNAIRTQKDRFLLGFGVAYVLMKIILWISREP